MSALGFAVIEIEADKLQMVFVGVGGEELYRYALPERPATVGQ
jgi:hypothetical protein